MFVEVTLYKSGFSPSDTLVCSSVTERTSALAGLPQKALPRSPYNPTTPYRLAGNFLEFDRLYDYARLQYFNDSESDTPAYARSFFINDFIYINDNVCDFRGEEDFIGELFHNIEFSFLQPSKYTYKKSDIANVDFDINIPEGLYKEEIDIVERGAPSGLFGGKRYYLGALIVTATVNLPAPDSYSYYENDTLYPINNIIVPFLINTDGQLYSAEAHSVYRNKGGDFVLRGLSSLYTLFSRTDNGFTIADISIDFNIFSYANISYSNELFIIEDKSDYITFEPEQGSAGASRWLYAKTFSAKPLKYVYPNYNALSRRPFERLRITCGSNDVQYFNPYFINNEQPTFTVTKSLLPPYNTTIKINVAPLPQTFPFTMIVQNSYKYSVFTNGYAEWLRNNYNATVTGLKVKQEAQLQNAQINSAANIVNSIITPSAAGIGKAAIGEFANLATTYNSQRAERQLLQLTLKDKGNAISQASFENSIACAWLSHGYLRVTVELSVARDLMLSDYKRYGVKAPLRITNTRSHARYDYLEANDFTFKPKDGVYLSDRVKAGISEQLYNGVRLWYTLDNFLNFDIDNPEV